MLVLILIDKGGGFQSERLAQARIRRIFLDAYGILDVRIIFFIFLRLISRMRTTCEYSGSPTKKAILLGAVTNLGMDMEKLKQDSTFLHVETFNFEKKRSGVSVKKNEDNTVHVHWKGAVEMVLAMCLIYYQKDGIMKSMHQEDKSRIKNLIQGMAASKPQVHCFRSYIDSSR
ncbi:calcium-transporting ATPase 12, plasma membrane-type protein [Tanacetum coccineum]